MKILVAEDDGLFRRLVCQVLAPEHEIVVAEDGGQAWALLQQPGHPSLALLDWVMPVLSGPQICRRVREDSQMGHMYLMLLTAKNSAPDIVAGLRAGADDYVSKPFIPEELRARVRVGERLLRLEFERECQMAEIRRAQERESRLRSLLPICPACKKVRVEAEYWHSVHDYLREEGAAASRACPGCTHEAIAAS